MQIYQTDYFNHTKILGLKKCQLNKIFYFSFIYFIFFTEPI
jgi:hypothetical protein